MEETKRGLHGAFFADIGEGMAVSLCFMLITGQNLASNGL